MMRAIRAVSLAALLSAPCLPVATAYAQSAQASSPQAALAAVLGAYARRAPIPGPFGLTATEAEAVQRMVVLNLRPKWGEVVGYKAALTSPAAQARFGVGDPVSGVLLDNMFTSTGATIDTTGAVRPVVEADLLVRVGDERINDASTRDEVLASLSEAIPFVEIPDLMFAELEGLTGADVTAINAGARLGATGTPIPLAPLRDAAARLGAFSVRLLDGNGHVLGTGTGSALLGHPLDAAMWLKNDLSRLGQRLKAGDLLSLGSLGPPLPLQGITRLTATYEGLADEPVSIHLGFK